MSTTTRRPGTSTRRPAPAARSTRSRTTAQRPSQRSNTRRPTRAAQIEIVRTGPTAEHLLVGSTAVLCLLGLVMVYSASSVASVQQNGASWNVVVRQFVFMLTGLAAAYLAARIPLAVWRDRLGSLLLVLAAVLQGVLALDIALGAVGGPSIPLAVTVNGATRWIGHGMLQGQPSDLVKLALVLWLARILDARHRELGSWTLLRPVLVVTGVLALLVLMGDDLGTTLLLGVIMLAMLFLAGAPVRQVCGIAAVGGLVAMAAVLLLDGFRLQRISAFFNPSAHMATEGYQLLQSQIGFASGGFWGSGPGNSRAKWGYLPEADTDFILAVIGEELGLIGSLVVLGAFVVFMFAGIRIAVRSSSRFGRLVAIGITTWIGVQALINIGVTVGTLPTKGITLPFVSYGGSSLMMCMLGVGVLLSVARDG